MPCCAPRYGPLIIAAIDTATGTAGLILLGLFRECHVSMIQQVISLILTVDSPRPSLKPFDYAESYKPHGTSKGQDNMKNISTIINRSTRKGKLAHGYKWLDSASAWLCILFPALLMLCLGPTLASAFLKRNTLLAVIAFWMNIILVMGCASIIVTMWTAQRFRESSYTPLFIAAEFYVIILQLHFSWVVHDFHANRLRFLAPFGSRKFQSVDEIDSYQQVIIA